MEGLTLYALLLITAPVQPELPEEMVPVMQPIIVAVAQELDIYDERQYWKNINLHGYLDTLRRDYEKMLDCPHLYEAESWQLDENYVREMISINQRFRCYMEGYLFTRDTTAQGDIRLEVIRDLEKREEIWQTLLSVVCSACGVTARRERLRDLKEMLGEEAYYDQRMPSPLPLIVFRSFD